MEKTIAHAVNCLEKQWGARAPAASGPDAGTWVWVVDFRGFGVAHSLQARLGIAFASIFRDHFPERLKCILLLNPPLLFRMLVGAIGAVADARTIAKLRVVEAGSAGELCEALREGHGVNNPSVLEWLRVALTTDPVPGSLPPVPEAAAGLQV